MSRLLRPRLLALAMAVGLIVVLAHTVDLTGPLERTAYDAHLLWPADRSDHPSVVLTLDPPALARYGRWPWPVAQQVALLARLQEAPLVIWPANRAQAVSGADPVPAAMTRHGRVLLLAPPDQRVAGAGARGIGVLGAVPDQGLRMRSVQSRGMAYDGISLLAQRLLHGEHTLPQGRRWIRFGAPGTIRQMPLSTVMAGRAGSDWRQAVVLVDVDDNPWAQLATPVGPMSAVMLVAQATQSLVSGQDGRPLPIGAHTFRLNLVPTQDVVGMLCLLDDVTALHERANTDGLTGLWNRRFFDEQIDVEMSRARRYRDYSVALVMIDVDHFKRFNDQDRHITGDRVLRIVAGLVKSLVRTTDFAVRYGGEEFAVLLTHTDQEGARLFAERLRQRFADVGLTDEHGNTLLHQVTVSVAVANFAGDETASAFLNRADTALYCSKSGGRNQVSVASNLLLFVDTPKA